MSHSIASYDDAVHHAVRVDWGSRSRIEVKGPDAALFLHNLCTNDVKNLAPGRGCEAFLCTHKAKVVAHIHLSRLPETETPTIVLDAVPGQNESIFNHLNRYLISEQAELTDITARWTQVLVAGPGSESILRNDFDVPLKDLPGWGVARRKGEAGYLRRRVDLSVPAFELWVPAERAAESWRWLESCPSASDDVIDVLRLEAGSPVFGQDMDTDRFVAELNRTEHAISYTKGCYLGQEPIVMARDRGHLNRLLVGLMGEGEEPFVAGSRVFSGDTEVGLITSSVYSPRVGKPIALAYLKRGYWEAGMTVTVFPPSQGRAAVVSSLPFLGPNADT